MTDADLLLHAGGLYTYVNANPSIGVDITFFKDVYTVKYLQYEADFTANQDKATRSHLTASRKRLSRKDLEPEVRQLETMLRAIPGLSAAVLISLNIYVRQGGRPPLNEKPTDIPNWNVFVGVIRHILIYFGLSGKKLILIGKPKGVHGAELKWAILDHRPTHISELIESSFLTKSPFDFEFGEEDRGKIFYFCIRWENTRGEKGPWSEIQEVRIP
jgi:hypothetical protein